MDTLQEIFGDPISSYTRADALTDGVLVDAGPITKEAGIRWPVALTRTVWERFVTVPPKVEGQDETGRLWDVVWMLSQALRRGKGRELTFRLYVRNDNRPVGPRCLVTLKAVSGPGDHGEPVLTIMLPEED